MGVANTKQESKPEDELATEEQIPSEEYLSPPTKSKEILRVRRTDSDDSSVHVILSPSASANQVQPEVFPTLFSWTDEGKSVYVTGSFNNWKEKYPLVGCERDYSTILNLKPGVHQYKFIVDGRWRHSDSQPMTTDNTGNLNNYVEVKGYGFSTEEPLVLDDDYPLEDGYSQEIPKNLTNTKKEPPILPPHLKKTLLNTAQNSSEPGVLPLPHHVMLRHLYSIPREEENAIVFGATQRYKEKFITTVFYTHSG